MIYLGKTDKYRVLTSPSVVGNKYDCTLQEQVRPGLWKTLDKKTVPFVQLAMLEFEKRVEKAESRSS